MEVQKASVVQSGDDSSSKGSKFVLNSNSAIARSVTAPIISKFSKRRQVSIRLQFLMQGALQAPCAP